MISRRTLLATAGLALPLVSACQPHRAGGVLTACDVHRDGYPTVTAVKWLGKLCLKKPAVGCLFVAIPPVNWAEKMIRFHWPNPA